MGAARESRKGAAPKKKYFTLVRLKSKFVSVSLVIKKRDACSPCTTKNQYQAQFLGGHEQDGASKLYRPEAGAPVA